jgi:phosphate transport system protein
VDEKLDDIRRRVLEMATAVLAMTEKAVAAIVERDEARARQVVVQDRDVDQREMDVDHEAYRLLNAGILGEAQIRFVVAALKTTTDLERIGDECVKLAHAGHSLVHHHLMPERARIEAFAAPVVEMLRDAVLAYEALDVALARSVMSRDDEIDDAYRAFAEELRRSMSRDLSALERLVQVRFAAKCLERIADHATNLAEQTIFIATGEDVRHAGAR